ncbi:MAG: hypothetical protein CVV57_06300 [Tenericutes bacterium HGW-Tenericutes-2]|jgi:lipopolysaccharide export LptBFGC system permease protein LptF|nr:MAG: hypothetical protein CVV57_06300 [Tenericutes bacterium HGW-Tenericutes-2]
MIFGILALALKNKTLGIVAIVSGVCFSILWLLTGFVGDSYTMIGALTLIIVTCLPDLIMGIISVSKVNKKAKIQSSNDITSNKGSLSLTDKLNEINSLRENGMLTEEEFLEAKKSILKS